MPNNLQLFLDVPHVTNPYLFLVNKIKELRIVARVSLAPKCLHLTKAPQTSLEINIELYGSGISTIRF